MKVIRYLKIGMRRFPQMRRNYLSGLAAIFGLTDWSRQSAAPLRNHPLGLSAIFVGIWVGVLLFIERGDFGNVFILDRTLALFVALSLVHFVSTYIGFLKSDAFSVNEQKPQGIFKTVFIALLVLTMLSSGFFLLDHSPDFHRMPRTAALLGVWLLGVSAILSIVFLKSLWKGNKV